MQQKKKTGFKDIDFAGVEFCEKEILARIEGDLLGYIKETDCRKSEMSHQDRVFLNGVIRKAKPKTIVEIGVSAGGSSCVILNAIRDLVDSKLYSFDYNSTWYRELDLEEGRKTGFLVHEVVPELLPQWELYTGGVPCQYFTELPTEGIDLCLIDTVHCNPGEHLNILEILPHMKENGIIIYHDTAYHALSDVHGTTCCVSLNTLQGKRILLSTISTMELPNIGAIVLDEDIENMLFPLFSNLSLPWTASISEVDYIEMLEYFSKHYPHELVVMYIYYCYFYMNGGNKRKKIAYLMVESAVLHARIKQAKIIHFHINDKFAKPTIDFINAHFSQHDHIHLVCRVLADNYSAQEFPSGNNVFEIDYNTLNSDVLKGKKLIFHSLFQKSVKLLCSHPELLGHSYWMVWGYDLYNAPVSSQDDFVRSNIYGIGSFCDNRLIRERYGSNHKFFETNLAIMPIDTNAIYAAVNRVKKDTGSNITIQINNSADDSTLEMLDTLSRFKDKNIHVRTVLSYGKTEFSQAIVEKGQRIFSEKFSYLDEMLSPEEYTDYLAGNDILILCQNRQQGGGNCISSILAEKKVFIKSEVTTSEWLRSLGIQVFDSNEITSMSYDEFISLSPVIATENRRLVEEKVCDVDHTISVFKGVFDDNCFESIGKENSL